MARSGGTEQSAYMARSSDLALSFRLDGRRVRNGIDLSPSLAHRPRDALDVVLRNLALQCGRRIAEHPGHRDVDDCQE